MTKEPRFPGIDWYCDHCGDLLNGQERFDDHKYTWKCQKCGYKNSISYDCIKVGYNSFTSNILQFIGVLSATSLYTCIMLCLAIFGFKADRQVYTPLLVVFLCVYVILLVLSIIIESHTWHNIRNMKSLIKVFLRDIWEDISEPWYTIRNGIAAVFGGFRYDHSTCSHIIWGALFIIMIIGEIVIFSRIVNYGIKEWGLLFSNAVSGIKELFSKFKE